LFFSAWPQYWDASAGGGNTDEWWLLLSWSARTRRPSQAVDSASNPMKSHRSLFFVLAFIFVVASSNAQGSFQNLDFESGTLVPIPGDSFNRVYFDQAFPGWRGYVGTNQETAAFHNGMFLCCSSIAISGGEATPNLAIEGTFSVALHAATGYESQPADTSIVQTGLVPAEAQSLLFRAQGFGAAATLAGQSLSLVPLAVGANYTLFGADVSSWAGQTAELRLTAIAPDARGNLVIFDSIEFSTTPIPEPSTLALFVVAGALGWLCCRWKGQ
jgi:hypothetical protein